ncbi:UNVERIFIED_CONTAM: hypothetical protein HDU68_004038 [Siphonaria sp. JEL0065]|nr:hypothetical protein HDU68_004038 [Siphonaria sp. JEL0065]
MQPDIAVAIAAGANALIANNLANLIIYLGGFILNSMLLVAVLRVPLLHKTKLCWVLLLLLVCYIGTSFTRTIVGILYLRWPLTYFCTQSDVPVDCTSIPSQVLGALQYTFVVFTLLGNLFLSIDRHTRVTKSREMSNIVMLAGLFLGALLSAAFIALFSLAPPNSPYFPHDSKGFVFLLAILYIPITVSITVLYFQIFRHVKKITRPNEVSGSFLNLRTRITGSGGVTNAVPDSVTTVYSQKRDPLEEYAHELSWAMTLTLAACYAPSLVYFAARAAGHELTWLSIIASIMQALDVIVSPILVLYFQRPYLQAFFNLYIAWMF